MGFSFPRPVWILLLAAAAGLPDDGPDELEVLKDRLRASCLEGRPESPDGIRTLMQPLAPDGSFEDVDYKDRTRSGWETVAHLNRTLQLARAFRQQGHPLQENASLRKAALNALGYWLEHRFTNPNWWWNRIGVPRTLGRILLLMEDALSGEEKAAGLALLKEARLGMTGQNLIWLADITIARGCLEGDPGLVARAFEAVADTITTAHPEGIQADYSFHQHGKCLYSGGYGLGFAVDCARLAVLARGTRFAFAREKTDLLNRYVLDGQQWMMRGDVFDYGAVGREISRKGKTGGSLAAACSRLAQLDTERRAELEAFARRIQGGLAPDDEPLSGNRHFFCSDIMTHHRPAYYASARMCSSRIDNTDDPCNDEGLLSHHIADGTTFIFRTGGEYADIFGVWDWQRIPGATIEQKKPSGTPRHRGANAFVGGVSDGTFGLAAADFEKDGLAARKAWFFFDREFVCLGAGIHCASEHAVYTSINQCHLRGQVIACAGGETGVCEKGRRTLEDARWVLHDGIGYLFFEPREVTVRNEAQSGSWWRINRKYPKEEISMEVFSLWIDHGMKPSNGAYAYIVSPGAERAGWIEYAASPPISVLRNTPGLQAVRHEEVGCLGAAFYEAGSLETDAGFRLEVDRPCLVLAREMKPGLLLSLSNPRNEALAVEVKINRRLEGEGVLPVEDRNVSRIVFELPGGARAGQSVVRAFGFAGRDGS